MTPIQINLHSPVYGYKSLNEKEINGLIESNGELLIKLEGWDCYNIYPGDKLIFKRYIYENDNTYFTITDYVEVLSEDEDHTLHTTIPSSRRIPLYPNDIKYVSGYTEDNTPYEYHILKCRENHNIFPQDVNGQSITIKDYEGNSLGEYENISIPLKRSDKAATSADCLTFIEKQESCGENSNKINVYEYNFLPEKISRNCIIVNGFDKDKTDLSKMAYLETKFNPFYFYYIETDEEGNPIEFNDYGEPVKHCRLYGDSWWETISAANRKDIKVNNKGNTRTEIGINSAYWNTNIGLSSQSNEKQLGSYDDLSASFIKDIEKSLVPEIIDMEKVKYSPMICVDAVEGVFHIATSITFDFHFRERKKIESDEERLKNTSITSGNVYCDGWYINPDSADTTWWNGMDYSESAFSQTKFNKFLADSGEISDLLGYLNFTDNDVFYRKKKVSKTFIRLLFYNSKDPIEQKLLYYSTIFLDSTKLYSKYVKQLMYMEDEGLLSEMKNLNTAVVSCSGGTRVDTEIVVTNEFDRTKSAEGFNIYLFAEDTNFGLDENGEKTIYMKVEFNHAGNGKTIPMISWPKNGDGDYIPLTIDNFIENLYIPIKIGYTNDRYIYYIPDAYKNENGDIKLVLFEPKLDFDEKKDAIEENNGAN